MNTQYQVKLISITPEAEKHIMYTARVSNPKNQDSNNSKLIGYCVKNKHWSILEQSFMTIEIITSRSIAQQILRHRSFSFQEYSQRYAEANSFIIYPARRQDIKNRQNSIDDLPGHIKKWFENAQQDVWNFSEGLYQDALAKGIAKEQARMLLPLNTQTKLYMSGSVRSWLHYIEVRTDPSTQLEHRQIAEACKDIFKQELPITAEALGWL